MNLSRDLYIAGWFARDPEVLRQVGHTLLQVPYSDVKQPRRVLVADDCFKLSLIPTEDITGPVIRAVQKLLNRKLLSLTDRKLKLLQVDDIIACRTRNTIYQGPLFL